MVTNVTTLALYFPLVHEISTDDASLTAKVVVFAVATLIVMIPAAGPAAGGDGAGRPRRRGAEAHEHVRHRPPPDHQRGRLLPVRARAGRPGAAEPPVMEPLRPEPADEGTHPPGPEPLWNESWYFDGISDDGSLGVYVRTGRMPNQDHCLFSAFVAGPGRPTVMLAHTSAPLPARRRPRAGDPCGRPGRRAALRGPAPALPRDRRGHRPVVRRPGGHPARRTGPGRADRPRADLRHRGDPLPVAAVHPVRDPLPGDRDGAGGRRGDRVRGPGPARPLVGRARLVGVRLDVERPAPGRRHPHPRGRRAAGAEVRRRLRPARRRDRRGHLRERRPRR